MRDPTSCWYRVVRDASAPFSGFAVKTVLMEVGCRLVELLSFRSDWVSVGCIVTDQWIWFFLNGPVWYGVLGSFQSPWGPCICIATRCSLWWLEYAQMTQKLLYHLHIPGLWLSALHYRDVWKRLTHRLRSVSCIQSYKDFCEDVHATVFLPVSVHK